MSTPLELSALKISALLHDPLFKPILFAAKKGDDVRELVRYVISSDRFEKYEKEGLEEHEKLARYIIEEVIKRLEKGGKLDLSAKVRYIMDTGEHIISKCDIASSSIDRSITYLFFPIDGKAFVNKIIFKHPIDLSEHDFTEEIRRLLYDEEGNLRKDEFKRAVDRFIEIISEKMLRAENGYEYHALWRILPASFAYSIKEAFNIDASWITLLPADTRSPSSTILDHLYATSALTTACVDGDKEIGLIYWEVEDKYDFISTARLPRDLWSGSYLISLSTFYVLMKLSEELGPCSIIRPLLHATPLYDAYLSSKGVDMSIKDEELTIPTIPGAAMVIVPGSKVPQYSSNILKWYKEAWSIITSIIIDRLRNARQYIQESLYVRIFGDEDMWRKRAETMPFNVNTAYIQIPWDSDERLSLLKELRAKNLLEQKEVEQLERLKTIFRTTTKSSEDKSSKELSFYEWGAFVKALTLFHFVYSISKSIPTLEELDVLERKQLCTMCWKQEAIIHVTKIEEVEDDQNKVKELYNAIRALHDKDIWIRDGERLCLQCIIRRSLYSVLDEVLKEVVGKKIKKQEHYPSTEEVAGLAFASTLAAAAILPEINIRKEIDKKIKQIIEKYENIFGGPLVRSLNYEDFKEAFQIFKTILPSLYEEHYLRVRSSSTFFKDSREALDKIREMKDWFSDIFISSIRENLQLWNLSIVVNLLENMKKGPIPIIVRRCSDYLAIVKGDGDYMADALAGRGAYEKKIEEMIPNRLAGFLTGFSSKNLSDEELDRLREIGTLVWLPGISYTYCISRALNMNSINTSRYIRENGGLVIYSGGDDVLAMVPPENTLTIVGEVRKEFSKEFIEFEDPALRQVKYLIPGLGSKASQSFGVLFFDAFFPLKKAIEEVEKLAEEAKEVESLAGKKDSMSISYRVDGPKAYLQFRLIGIDKLVKLLQQLVFLATLQSQNRGLVKEGGGYKVVEGFSEKILRVGRIEEHEDLELFRAMAMRAGVSDIIIRQLSQFLNTKLITPRGKSNVITELLRAALSNVGAIRESSPIAIGDRSE